MDQEGQISLKERVSTGLVPSDAQERNTASSTCFSDVKGTLAMESGNLHLPGLLLFPAQQFTMWFCS